MERASRATGSPGSVITPFSTRGTAGWYLWCTQWSARACCCATYSIRVVLCTARG